MGNKLFFKILGIIGIVYVLYDFYGIIKDFENLSKIRILSHFVVNFYIIFSIIYIFRKVYKNQKP